MQYCPKCGGVMIRKREKKKLVLECVKCGATAPYTSSKIEEKVTPVKKSIDVVIETQEEDEKLQQELREAFLESYDMVSEEEEGEE